MLDGGCCLSFVVNCVVFIAHFVVVDFVFFWWSLCGVCVCVCVVCCVVVNFLVHVCVVCCWLLLCDG